MSVELSIIVPAYNAGKYLSSCLNSILASTYRDFEILLVDDGSTDSTGELCEQFQRENPKITVFHTPNRGLPSARNLGIEHASGRFIGFVDADDLVAPDMFEKLLRTVADDAQMGICRYRKCSRGNEENVLVGGLLRHKILQREDIAKYISDGSAGPYVWNKIYHRDILERNGIRFRADAQGAEDLYFNMEYLQYCNKAAWIEEELYYYIVTEGSITNIFRANDVVSNRYMSVPRASRYAAEITTDISQKVSREYQARAAMFYQTILRKLETPSQEYICEAVEYVKKNKSSLLRHRWGWKYYCSALLLCVDYRLWASIFRRAVK